MSFTISIRGLDLVVFSLLIDESLEHLLVLNEVSGGVVKGSVGFMVTDPEAVRVDGSPSAIQAGKGRKDPHDGLMRVRDVFSVELVL